MLTVRLLAQLRSELLDDRPLCSSGLHGMGAAHGHIYRRDDNIARAR
jgi:hypothetical protein